MKCLTCNSRYFGSTHQFGKLRTSQHLSDAVSCINSSFIDGIDKNKDSFTRHMKQHHKNISQPVTVPDLRNVIESRILKSGLIHSFGTPNCSLCKHEKFTIWSYKGKMMNKRNELLSTCRHKPKLQNLKLIREEAW